MRRQAAGGKIEEVSIDTCDKCGGVWLDAGELEQLTKREAAAGFWQLWGESQQLNQM